MRIRLVAILWSVAEVIGWMLLVSMVIGSLLGIAIINHHTYRPGGAEGLRDLNERAARANR